MIKHATYASKKFGSDKIVRSYLCLFMLPDVKCLASMLWSIDSCHNRVSADQCHMTVSRAQAKNSLRWRVLFNFSAARLLYSTYSRLTKLYFRKTFPKSSHESFAFGLAKSKSKSKSYDVLLHLLHGIRSWHCPQGDNHTLDELHCSTHSSLFSLWN